jgi:hypothetical protein
MTSLQAKQWLSQGIAAARAGDAERARELLLQAVDADEYSEQAWLWLSSVVESDADREVCLENVLAINPDNNLAKAGLVHLRTRKMPQPPPPKPEPTPPPPQPKWPPVREQAAPAARWKQSQVEPAAEFGDLPEERLTTEVEKAAAAARTKEKPGRGESGGRPRLLFQAARTIALLGLGLLVAAIAAMFVLRIGPFDPSRRDYASAMRPVLADYEAWWDGPYGALVTDLNRLCGPTADGWRNRDVLLSCGRYPALDCALVAAHCGSDIDAMRERVAQLSQEAQQTGQTLLATFDDIVPPDDVAPAHAHFLACLQAQVADVTQMDELANGRPATRRENTPACQMFPHAEEQVRRYVSSW